MKRVLLVDDDMAVLSALQRALRSMFGSAVTVDALRDPLLALAQAQRCRYDVVLSDLRMPDLDGLAFLTLMAAVQPQAVRVMLTGSADFETAQRAINDAGVFRYLCKPWDEHTLRCHLEAALHQAEINQSEAASNKPVHA